MSYITKIVPTIPVRINRSNPLSASLRGFWLLGGDAVDVSHQYAGTLNNVQITNSGVGPALSFNGTSSYVNFGNVLDVAANDFTLASWIKAPNTSQFGPIVYKRQTTGPYSQWGLIVGYINSGGNPTSSQNIGFFGFDGATQQSFYTTASVVDGNVHHVAVTRNSSGIKIYVDGVSAALTTVSTGNISENFTNPGPLYFGAGDGLAYFNGVMWGTGIWSRALSNQEIATLYSAPFSMLEDVRRTIVNHSSIAIVMPSVTWTWTGETFSANVLGTSPQKIASWTGETFAANVLRTPPQKTATWTGEGFSTNALRVLPQKTVTSSENALFKETETPPQKTATWTGEGFSINALRVLPQKTVTSGENALFNKTETSPQKTATWTGKNFIVILPETKANLNWTGNSFKLNIDKIQTQKTLAWSGSFSIVQSLTPPSKEITWTGKSFNVIFSQKNIVWTYTGEPFFLNINDKISSGSFNWIGNSFTTSTQSLPPIFIPTIKPSIYPITVLDSSVAILDPNLILSGNLIIIPIDMRISHMIQIGVFQMSNNQDFSLRGWISNLPNGQPLYSTTGYYLNRGDFPITKYGALPVILFNPGQTPPIAQSFSVEIPSGVYYINIQNLANEANIFGFTLTELA